MSGQRSDWKKIGIFAVAVILVTAISRTAAAQDNEALQLAPSSAWYVDYADDSCALTREFGGPETPVYLEIRQFEPGSQLQVLVASDEIRRRQNRPLRLRFEPGEDFHESDNPTTVRTQNYGEGFIYTTSLIPVIESDGQRMYAPWSWEEQQRRESEIAGIRIEEIFREDFVLQTGEFNTPMNVMRSCIGDLVESWGFDAEEQFTLSRRAAAVDIGEWSEAIMHSYPSHLASSGKQGLVRAWIRISSEGVAQECRALSSMNDPDFDEVACELLLEHGRFEPALDANGQPVDSFDVFQVHYRRR